MRTIRNVWIAGWIVLVFVIYVIQDRFQFDLWQHLACGRQIVQSGHLLYTDTFSHTVADQPYVDQNWLSQVVFYCVYALGGLTLLTLFVAGLYAASLILICHCCWKRSNHYFASILCGVLALGLSLENLFMRPQAFSALLFAAGLFVLWNFSDFWKPAAVALIVLLWTNCHGAFTLGIGLPGIFLLGAALTEYQAERRWGKAVSSSSVKSYLLCVGVAIVVSFCNPQPAHTFSYVAKTAANAIKINFREWEPVGVNSVTGIAFLCSIMAALVILNRSRRKLGATELLLLLVFLYLGLKALRMIAWWGFVLAPVLAVHLAQLVRDLPEKRLKLGPLLLYVVVVMLTIGAALPLIKKSSLMGPNEEPVGMIEFVKKTPRLGNVFNTLELGGYLMWHGEGKLKVFVDGRVDPFPLGLFRDYLAVTYGREDWNEILARYKVDSIIASKTRNPTLVRNAKKSKEWGEVYSDPLVAVFERTRR